VEPKVYDLDGTEKDWDWVTEVYGAEYKVAEVSPGEQVYRLVEAVEREGAATQIVTVLDENGEPKANVPVARFWPGAPELSPKPASPWKNKAVVGKTNSGGDVGFGMGRGDYITHPGAGVSAVWVADPEIPSDLVDKLGMIAGTNHRHLDFVFQVGTESTGGAPTPGSGTSDDIEQRLSAVESRVEELASTLPTQESLDALQGSLNELSDQLTKIEAALQAVRQALSNIGQ